nr:MAG TPA: hypothetical protein [Caudoviricetes sp.]
MCTFWIVAQSSLIVNHFYDFSFFLFEIVHETCII